MRIGEINDKNYMELLKLFSGNKNIKPPVTSSENEETETFKFDPSEQVNQFGLKGMSLTGRDDSWKKIVDVSDDIREKMINLARREFVNNYGMSDGEEYSALIGKYLASVPENDRLSVAWTLGQIDREESTRLRDYVRSEIPNWQNGQPFDRSILAEAISNGCIDKKV